MDYRRVRLIKGSRVEINDSHDGSRPAELSLMLAAKPSITDDAIVLETGERIAVSGAGSMRVEEIAITDARLLKAWPERIYRVLVPLAIGELNLVIESSGGAA